MSRETMKDREWYRKRCEEGCQICGVKFPGRKNFGLVEGHIFEAGPNEMYNIIVLCPNCEKSFDEILKPAIYEALMKYNYGELPEKWNHNANRNEATIQ